MKMWNEYQETTELMNELNNAEVEYEVREHGKIFINVTNDDDELEGIWKVEYYDYWNAYKMIYYFLEGNEIKSDKTIAFNIEQVIENILG